MLCFLSLGSNLDNPIHQVKTAITEITSLNRVKHVKSSSLYLCKVWGRQEQPDFINAVLALETSLSALELLDKCQEIEDVHHRVRKEKWSERTLDIDILLYGRETITSKRLTVPHPYMLAREFVLVPLYEIAPDLDIPKVKLNLKELLSRVDAAGCKKIKQ